PANRPGPEHHVYQPRIRVRACDGVRLIPLEDDAPTADEEAASLALMYSTRRALARGHLCGAVWREIDPERPAAPARPLAPPFFWLDGTILPAGVADPFSPADARSELVPCYSIEAPLLDATDRHGGGVFDPDVLSELWEPAALRRALSPLADSYERWIRGQNDGIERLPAQHRPAAVRHMQESGEI